MAKGAAGKAGARPKAMGAGSRAEARGSGLKAKGEARGSGLKAKAGAKDRARAKARASEIRLGAP
jgi:hypothetical protein